MTPSGAAPSISVLVLCRNHERYVESCLRSVLAADQPCEVVFVDNGSIDRSVAIASATLAGAPAHVSSHVISLTPERSLCEFFNIAVRASTGTFIKPISSDDKLGPNFFETFRKLTTTSAPGVGVWLAGSVIIDDADTITRQQYPGPAFGTPGNLPPRLLAERHLFDHKSAPAYTAVSMFYRRDVYEQVGGYDERFRYEDRPFLFNVLKRGWIVEVHPFNNTYYRVHRASSSADQSWMAEARLPILWNHTLRANWRNKPIGAFHLARHVRYVAMDRLRKRFRR